MAESTLDTTVCTIVSKNYLHHARTLMDSLRVAHPRWSQHVLLVDTLAGEFDPANESFALHKVNDLPLPDRQKFLYRYDILELNTAVKPWFLEKLFHESGVHKVIYLDPDIFVYRPLAEVEALLDDGALMALTPHLTGELDDDKRPSEHDILKSGCYNLGFIALARHAQLMPFLKWWQSKLEFDCRVSIAENLFVDQRWMDLTPGLFDDVRVLRHEGYNVAYWNLKHRAVAKVAGGFEVNGVPLAFFHFSGLDVNDATVLSKHQDRFRLRELPAVAELVRDYAAANRANGSAICRGWPYAFGLLDDGSRIATTMRQLYRSQPALQELVGHDPFANDHDYLNRPWGSKSAPLVTLLMRHLWESRGDLQAAFPDIDSLHRLEFADWFAHDTWTTATFARRFVEPVRQVLDHHLASLGDRAAASFGAASPSLAEQSETSTAARCARATIRWLYFALPYQPSEQQLRACYHRMRPIAALLPPSLRLSGLKADVRRWQAQKRAKRRVKRSQHGGGLVEAIGRWLKSLLTLAPAALATTDHAQKVADSDDSTAETPVLDAIEPSILPFACATPRDGHGIDIVGYIRSEHGVGESARLCAMAARAVQLPFTLHDFNHGNLSRTADRSWDDRITSQRRNRVAVLHINADQTPAARKILGRDFFQGGYTVGFWHWELPVFPDQWLGAFDLVDEVWVPTQFLLEAVQARSHRPVARMPHAISFAVDPTTSRATFGLPDDRFLFLAMYDVLSTRERKNPEGAIAAYRKAFPRVGRDTALVIKLNNPDRDRPAVNALKARVADRSDIIVLDRILMRQEVYDLENVCDAFVSLHRSEGFGLGLAESMFLGKPVVATDWSGNRDFMSPDNSCPVNYRLIRLDRNIGPYDRGQIWADPDLDHAAQLLKRLVEDVAWRQRIGRRGQQTIHEQFSPEIVGALYRKRLGAILGDLGLGPSNAARVA